MKFQCELDNILLRTTAQRRVVILQRALFLAKKDVRAVEKFWRQLARDDEDAPELM